MVLFEKSKKILEYDKIIEKISSLASTEGGKHIIRNLEPSDDKYTVHKLLMETEEAFDLLSYKGSPSFFATADIINSVDRSCKNAILTTQELLDISSLLKNASSLKNYPNGKELSYLTGYFQSIVLDNSLQQRIDRTIIAVDLIADDASPELLSIRKAIKKAENDVRESLNRIITGNAQKYLQEPIVTQRSGRFVVPVKASYKSEIKGIVHDSSASGATLFVEPAAVVEANNRLRDYLGREKEEIEKILRELSASVSSSSQLLLIDYNVLIHLDAIFAKASYSSTIRGIRPEIDGKLLRIQEGRHPLIDPSKVVPITLSFGDGNNSMIITGPNTGGKTVTLKTIGLFVYMTQSGIFPPCRSGSSIPIFGSVMADIGDEQSIEQSLSTFSAHMSNIVSILEKCDDSSLVLLDELGSGTDPVEGAALAISILDNVRAKGAYTVATTHYSELKLYAIESEGVINASCEFDVETLSPTYRLIVGRPGSSNAFAISSKLGLPTEIIDKAKLLLNEDNIRFESILSKLEEAEQIAEKSKREMTEAIRKNTLAEIENEKLRKKLLEQAESELEHARMQANRILESAKSASKQVFEELNSIKKESNKIKDYERIEKARLSVQDVIHNSSTIVNDDMLATNQIEDYVLPRELKPGDAIILCDIGQNAIVKAVNGDVVICTVGRTETKTNLSNVRLNVKPITKDVKKKGTSSYSSSLSYVKNEIDVRGMVGDDAWFAVDRWLEDVILAGYSTVTVIHGKGTGALRSALWQYFRSDKRISSFRLGKYGEGETGVTVLEIKK